MCAKSSAFCSGSKIRLPEASLNGWMGSGKITKKSDLICRPSDRFSKEPTKYSYWELRIPKVDF